jgi:hypothetical protein
MLKYFKSTETRTLDLIEGQNTELRMIALDGHYSRVEGVKLDNEKRRLDALVRLGKRDKIGEKIYLQKRKLHDKQRIELVNKELDINQRMTQTQNNIADGRYNNIIEQGKLSKKIADKIFKSGVEDAADDIVNTEKEMQELNNEVNDVLSFNKIEVDDGDDVGGNEFDIMEESAVLEQVSLKFTKEEYADMMLERKQQKISADKLLGSAMKNKKKKIVNIHK